MNWWALRRRIHISWLIAWLSGGIVLGVILAQYIPSFLFHAWLWLVVGVNLALIVGWQRYIWMIPLVIMSGVTIGLWRGSLDQAELQPYAHLTGRTVTITGQISDDAEIDEDGKMILRLEHIAVFGHELAGRIWVSLQDNADIRRSDIVTVHGKMNEGFGSFSAAIYRAELRKIQRPQPGDVALQVRDSFAESVRTAVDDPEASLGIGYLVGQRRTLPPELDEALRVAGLTHVVVASGYNLTILVRLARRLFVRVSKYLSVFVSGGMIVAFIAVTGMSPSMSRAGLVTGLSLLAWYYGRKFHPLVLLPLAAAITLLLNPSYGWNDLGWQLSFAAFAGVMIVAPLAQRFFFGDKKPGTLRQILGETIAAQLVTLPILILAFSQFSNVSIIANLLVLPLVPLAMLLTFIAGIGALLLPGMAMIIGAPAEWLLFYMINVAKYLADLPWALTQLEVSWTFVAVSYVLIIGFTVYMWRKTKFHLRDSNIVE